MERNVSSRPSGFWKLFATFAVAACTLAGVLAGCTADDYAIIFTTSDNGAQAGVPDGFEEAEVVRVVDGDTLQVYLNGEKQKVRLIGINCPESVATDESRNTAEGRDASEFTHELLSEGDVVWLQSDVNDTDQYDRLLRYVWIEAPANPYTEDEVAAKMLNAILVAEGFAEAHVYGADDLYADVLDDLEREAVANERGVSYMWA